MHAPSSFDVPGAPDGRPGRGVRQKHYGLDVRPGKTRGPDELLRRGSRRSASRPTSSATTTSTSGSVGTPALTLATVRRPRRPPAVGQRRPSAPSTAATPLPHLEHRLLALAINQLMAANWQRGGGKGRKPQPLRLPGDPTDDRTPEDRQGPSDSRDAPDPRQLGIDREAEGRCQPCPLSWQPPTSTSSRPAPRASASTSPPPVRAAPAGRLDGRRRSRRGVPSERFTGGLKKAIGQVAGPLLGLAPRR
jgi:hypothetical protein